MDNDLNKTLGIPPKDLPSNIGTISRIHKNTWKFAFILGFLALVVDGLDIMLLAFSLTSLKADFGIDNVQAGMIGSATLAGMAIGGILGGWACDKFGRVRLIAWSVISFSSLTCLLGFAQNFEQFIILRFLGAFGLGSIYMACNTMMAEYVPTKYRTTVLGTLQAAVTVGYIVATLMAKNILPEYGWRMMFFASIIPGIFALILTRFVPEPASWQEAKIKQLSHRSQPTEANTHMVKVPSESIFKLIFKNPKHRNTFFLWVMTAAFLQFGYYGISNWMPTFLETQLNINLKSLTSFMIGTYVAMIFGKVIAGWASDIFGRRPTFVFGTVGTAICLPLIIFYNTPDNIVYLLVGFGFLYGIPYAVNATYMAESFPTEVRGTAIGTAYNVGRIGGAVAPIAIGIIASGGSFTSAFVIMGLSYLIAGIIPFFFIRERQYDPQEAPVQPEHQEVLVKT